MAIVIISLLLEIVYVHKMLSESHEETKDNTSGYGHIKQN